MAWVIKSVCQVAWAIGYLDFLKLEHKQVAILPASIDAVCKNCMLVLGLLALQLPCVSTACVVLMSPPTGCKDT